MQAEFKRGLEVYVTLPNNSGTLLKAGDLVQQRAAGGIERLANRGSLLGICHEDIPNGTSGPVKLPVFAVYKVKAAAGVNFAPLSPIYAAGNGTFGTGSTGDIPCGWVVDFDPAEGGWFRAVLVCEKFRLPAKA